MKKLFIFIAVIAFGLFIIKKKDMTFRQSFLRSVYPFIMLKDKLVGKKTIEINSNHIKPVKSFYELTAVDNKGAVINFTKLKGKKVLIVNTASDCGYTNQYEELQKLYELYKDKLIILGFPANDFKQQEKGSDEQIAAFCKINFGVSFPLMQKSTVSKGAQQHAVFQWLTDATKNGWNNVAPQWNFSKYLVDEEGILTNYFATGVSPLSKEVTENL